MPDVFLSPSTQGFQFYSGGSEEYYMNLIADAMIPYLRASGIEFTRTNPGESVPRVIERSNERIRGLHLALHAQATPAGKEGPLRGIDVYHFAVSPVGGERAAYIISENLKNIYPEPELVRIVPNYVMQELRLTDSPAVLVELGYFDNPEDALWIKNNIDEIGRALAKSVAEFLQIPFVEPLPPTVFYAPAISGRHTINREEIT